MIIMRALADDGITRGLGVAPSEKSGHVLVRLITASTWELAVCEITSSAAFCCPTATSPKTISLGEMMTFSACPEPWNRVMEIIRAAPVKNLFITLFFVNTF